MAASPSGGAAFILESAICDALTHHRVTACGDDGRLRCPLKEENLKKKAKPEAHVQYHKDGSVWASGQTLDGAMTGYWEWFRKDGVRMRSGHFELGERVGEWTTYDTSGKVYKVTTMKPKKKPK